MDIGTKLPFLTNRWILAFWTVGVAFLLTLVLSSVIEPGVSPLFLIAVMVSAWRGGLRAGLFATFLSAVASAVVFLPPKYSMDVDLNDLLQLAVFGIAAVSIGTLSASRRRAQIAREEMLVNEKKARLEAERANSVKDEFLAAVSHELRTPLTTIKTLTRVLQRREMSDAERAEYLEDLSSECDREIDLVLNLLDVSRIRAGGMEIQRSAVNVSEVIDACRKLVLGETDQMRHEVSVNVAADLSFAHADASALRRALCSILENAVKFSGTDGAISITAAADSDKLTISIADSGPGISEEDLPHIFEKFYRGGTAAETHPSPQEVPGIGLGLNLAMNLIQGMGGTISAESTIGRGSIFTVTLLVWKEAHSAAATATV